MSWYVGLNMYTYVCDASIYCKNKNYWNTSFYQIGQIYKIVYDLKIN